MVPSRNTSPVWVQRTLLMGIRLLPESRSSWASTVKVTVLFPAVWALMVTITGFSLAGMDGTESGSASGKLMEDGLMVSWAAASGRMALTSTTAVAAWPAPPQNKQVISRMAPRR
jgi:hypothetical protein